MQLPAEDQQKVADAVAAALAGRNGGRYLMEFRTGGGDGAPLRWVESRAQTSFGPDGTTLWLAGVTLDITERKEAQHLQERFVRSIAEQSVFGVAVLHGPAEGMAEVMRSGRAQTGREVGYLMQRHGSGAAPEPRYFSFIWYPLAGAGGEIDSLLIVTHGRRARHPRALRRDQAKSVRSQNQQRPQALVNGRHAGPLPISTFSELIQ